MELIVVQQLISLFIVLAAIVLCAYRMWSCGGTSYLWLVFFWLGHEVVYSVVVLLKELGILPLFFDVLDFRVWDMALRLHPVISVIVILFMNIGFWKEEPCE